MTADNETPILRGVLPVIPTLFSRDNQIDFSAQRQVVDFALENGASAVVCPAVASEYNFLSLEERKSLVSLVVEQVGGRLPIIGGASAQSVEEVVAAANDCLSFGIHHLMIMAPKSRGKDLDGHKEFFADITSRLGESVRIILQNAPDPIGAGLDANSMIELAKSNPAIRYVKEETLPSGPSITALIQCNVDHLIGVIGGGGARYMIDELNRGALAAMPAIEILDLHVAIFNAHARGDAQTARRLYRDSLPLLVSQLIYRMRLTKHVLNQRGVKNDVVVRAPLPEMDDATEQDINTMWADLKETLT